MTNAFCLYTWQPQQAAGKIILTLAATQVFEKHEWPGAQDVDFLVKLGC
jgi:hypothetical protein